MTSSQEDLLTQGDPINGKKCVKVTVTGAAMQYTKEVAAYVKSLIIKAAPGALLSLSGYNSDSALWIQLFDSATLPADTAVPRRILYVPTLTSFNFPLPPGGLNFANGIVAVASSTGPTKTLEASAGVWFQADYQ